MTKQIRYACFSDAIREGARLTPHGTKCLWVDQSGGTCAVGAGALAVGHDPKDQDWGALERMFPYLDGKGVCPECGDDTVSLVLTIADLFDNHNWTREQIADWLWAEEEKLGFITLTEEAEAFNPTMISELSTVKVTA